MLETAAHKVKPHHLAREACLYVRQSSLKQVETNTESTHRQYGLRRNAIALGWREDRIRVIDDDQGKSGASAANRSGFRGMPGHRERQQACLHEQGYLTARAMASQLGIDVSTVRERAKRGRLLCERIRPGGKPWGKPRPMYKLPPRIVPTEADAS